MTHDTNTQRSDAQPESSDSVAERARRTAAVGTTSRRTFLQLVGAGAVLGAIATGTSRADGIPTPWLHRDGNLIRDPSDNKVILRGVNIPDVSRLNADNYYSYTADEYITWATNGNSPPGTTDSNGWYARVIRLPAQPVDIGGHDPGGAPPAPAFSKSQLDSYVQNHLRPAVDRCGERGVYCIVDYHRHRGKWDENLWYTSDAVNEELELFWSTVAPEFANDSHVLFEVYNEPIEPYPDEVDPASDSEAALSAWNQWKSAAQPWVDTIRQHAPQNLVLIGSPRWSQWTAQAPRNEFDGDNLAYTGHVYGQDNLKPFSDYFGVPSQDVPVFLTEWGYKTGRAPYLSGTTDVEGQMYLDLFENYPIHPVPWIFDFRWVPQFFNRESRDDWQLLRTNDTHGGLVKDLLYEHRNSDIPQDDGTPTPTPTTTTTTAETPTETTTETPIEGLLIDDYDGSPAWPSANDLGKWTGSGDLESIGVTDGALAIDYNASGWYGTQVAQDITDYPILRMTVVGENGGEHEDIRFVFGGVQPMLSEVTDDTIETTQSTISVDLEAAGVDLSAPGQLSLKFYNGGNSAIEIEKLWLESR